MNRIFRVKFLLFFALLLAAAGPLYAQGFSFNCARDTALPGCPANLCFTLKVKIPDPHRQSNNYAVNSPGLMPTCLLASNNPGIPGAPTTLNVDDRYSPAFPIGFPFMFFGTPYSNLVAASNGYISFDVSLAGTFSHWNIINGGNPQNLPSTFYDRAIIMGPYHDIDVGITTSPNRLISYQTSGLAPYRKWVLNYFRIPLFSAACNNLIENTHQIILYESTGIIDVNIFDKQICTGWNQGRAMVGVQNFGQNIGVMAPGRFATDPPWGSVGMNESWRFIPIGGTPLFKRVELYDMSGNLVSTGTTVQLPNGDREASFPNVCPPAGGSTPYVIRAFYDKIDDPAVEIFGTDTVMVNRTRALTATPNTFAASCGNTNGTIRVTGTNGGSGTYEFSLDGTNWQSDSTFSGLASGTYTVYIRDVPVNCTSTYTVNIGNIANLSATTTNTATTCSGINNGTITVTSCTGLPPFSFSLNGGAYQSGPLPFTFNNLSPGSYSLIVRDANNCVTNTSTVTVTTGTGINVTTSGASSACGTPTGTIVATPSGGVGPYTYQLGTGTPQTGGNSYTFTGLAPGVYNVTVTDITGCTRTVTRTVTSTTTIAATMPTTPASCASATNGTVMITPTNGTAPYQFSIDGGTPVTANISHTFTNLAPGSHIVLIVDATGCTRNATINIGTATNFSGTATPGATSCSGSATGTITVNITGGQAPFSFVVDGGAPITATTNPYTITGITSGLHSVYIRDAAGCRSNVMNVIVSSGPPFVTSASMTNAVCNGSPTGSITVTPPTTGTPPYRYSIDGGTTWQTNNVFNGVAAGTYTVMYSEAGGCQGTQSITVGEASSMVTAINAVAATCNGLTDGIVTATASGGQPPYQYSIDGGTTWQSSNVFNAGAGSYTVLVRDANNCTSPLPVTVTEPAVLTASATNSAASCDGGNDGLINVSANGGNTGGYTYSIDGTSFQPSSTFNVGPGTYTVTVRDNLGCTVSFPDTVLLGSNFALTQQRDTTICEGNSVQLALASNATQYAWSPATGLSNAAVYNPVASPTVTTQYIVTATLGRCSGQDTVVVNVHPAPIPNAGPDGFICFGQTYQLQGSGGLQYSWSPAAGLDNTSVPNPTTSSGRDITYTLSILSDANGCRSLVTDQVYIDVTPPLKVKTIPYDTIGYPGAQIQLLAIPSDNDVISYTWTPATGLSDATLANPVVTLGAAGDITTYRVLTSTQGGCKGEGFVTIRVYKGPDIYVPNGFTPNGDGRNDRFTPFPVGVQKYNYFQVYNRWGQMIFSTTRLHDGWDGKLGGKEQPSGVYVWLIEAVTVDGRVVSKKGTVTLIR